MQSESKNRVLEPYYPLLRRATLFRDMEEGEIARLCRCLQCYVQDFEKGEYLFLAEAKITAAGILLEGRTCAESLHLSGEQVGFVRFASPSEPTPRLDMMGGEFCLNATRAFAALLDGVFGGAACRLKR